MSASQNPISQINPDDWPCILRIQAEAYSAIEPESAQVMQSKWRCSPDTCLVFRDTERAPLGYLLAHPWGHSKPPSLGIEIPRELCSDKLYLHDLAVSSQARGTGAASQLVQYLIELAGRSGFRQISLMSIQSSLAFWQKQGFVLDESAYVCETYGAEASYMTLALQR